MHSYCMSLHSIPSPLQETTFCLDISSLNLGVVVTSVFVRVAASNQFQTSAFSNATYMYPGKWYAACICVSPWYIRSCNCLHIMKWKLKSHKSAGSRRFFLTWSVLDDLCTCKNRYIYSVGYICLLCRIYFFSCTFADSEPFSSDREPFSSDCNCCCSCSGFYIHTSADSRGTDSSLEVSAERKTEV